MEGRLVRGIALALDLHKRRGCEGHPWPGANDALRFMVAAFCCCYIAPGVDDKLSKLVEATLLRNCGVPLMRDLFIVLTEAGLLSQLLCVMKEIQDHVRMRTEIRPVCLLVRRPCCCSSSSLTIRVRLCRYSGPVWTLLC